MTERVYASHIKHLRADTGKEDLSADIKGTFAAMDARYSFTSTRVALSALRKLYPDNKEIVDEMMRRREQYKKLDTAQEPTEKQKKKFISWDDIITFRTDYQEGMSATEKLLINLYTLIPPARADYGKMLIVDRKPKTPEDGCNYLILRPKTASFLFHAFKTHRTMGDQMAKIPASLQKIIREYVKPGQKYLLEHDGKPWSDELMSMSVRRMFQKYLHMDTGISMIRHAYCTNVHAGEKSITENGTIAKKMMHSPMLSQCYRFLSLE
jgi:hypothetical protein